MENIQFHEPEAGKKSEIKEVPIYKTHHVIALEVKDY